MLLNCDECILEKTRKNNGTAWFNFELNKFEVHNLVTDEEILLFFDNKLSKFKK